LNAAFGEKQGLEHQHINGGCGLFVAHTLRGEGFDASEDGTGRGVPLVPVCYGLSTQQEPKWAEDAAPTLALPSKSGGGQVAAVAFDLRGRKGGAQFEGPHDTANLRAASGGSSRSYVAQRWAVRRLTPTECERLQGFPDGWTQIAWRGKATDACPDGPRYKALGNSMAVPVMRWIGERLMAAMPDRPSDLFGGGA
jgi:DNA (cytosine-5)-methyltransferase 1